MTDVRYWMGAARSLGRNMRHGSFWRKLLTAGVALDQRPKAREQYFLDAYPEVEHVSVPLGDVQWRISNLDPLEQFVISALALLRNATTVFEIGTYDGATTLTLARTLPRATIYTLDLPAEAASRASVVTEASNVFRDGVGSRFRSSPEAARITQLLGDSRHRDSAPGTRMLGHDEGAIRARLDERVAHVGKVRNRSPIVQAISTRALRAALDDVSGDNSRGELIPRIL